MNTNIEVTEKTFYSIFSDIDHNNTDRLELANKYYYWNSNLEQNGIMIYNHISAVKQYYLVDINA